MALLWQAIGLKMHLGEEREGNRAQLCTTKLGVANDKSPFREEMGFYMCSSLPAIFGRQESTSLKQGFQKSSPRSTLKILLLFPSN
jgi:hypothetical protein